MADNFSVFVVEDDEFYSEVLEYRLSMNPDITVTKFNNAQDFLKNLDKNPGAITLDYSLPDMSGEEVLRRIKEYNSDIPVVMVSGQEDIKTAITLLKDGAYDYIVKDEDTKDRIWNAIKNIRENIGLKREIYELKQQVKKKYDFTTSIIGNSPSMKRVFAMIEKAVSSNITVSITGETGTGKEVVAKSIHYNSSRSKKPFVAVNITAIPAELIESELFGHEKGSFTGATARRVGKFEEAGEGTIFLDEIGEMDINMQSKLLRVLQERELTRVGGNGMVKITCRVISATHKDLAEEVRKGNFREDLYYRLLGLPVSLPPLRERANDTLVLAKHFIDEYATENELGKLKLSSKAQNKLFKYPWPGNIRELKAVVELCCVMTDSNTIEDEHITFNSTGSIDTLLQNEMSLEEYKNRIVKYYLDKYNNDVINVAKRLDMGKSTIYRMLQDRAV
ncbi:sigma-54 dependent transcriptional regulator [Bacteroidia bacterium]|nr:sigma-54 dependent transcriptional regulator [Bacteroidia bacterium]MDB9881834.1 sigma-54 dependent transcriptional regulator [Bacteroidia bacterium]MDC1395605.1 sigma-54 dependent transcriptional regulator [Bacteroidia bacterium]